MGKSVRLTGAVALTHDGGGDSQTVANMVKYAIDKVSDPDEERNYIYIIHAKKTLYINRNMSEALSASLI